MWGLIETPSNNQSKGKGCCINSYYYIILKKLSNLVNIEILQITIVPNNDLTVDVNNHLIMVYTNMI